MLLIEAGGEADEDPDNLIPGLVVPKFGNEAGNWLYETTPQGELNGRTILYPRGRGMGGSSANNFSAWCRGPKCDWDHWAELTGDEWWRWDNVVEHMKAFEDFQPECPNGMDEYVKSVNGMHHQGGPIVVGPGNAWQPLVKHCVKAVRELGQPLNTDHNDGDPIGISVSQMNVDKGVRRSSAAAFLGEKARTKFDNLVVVTRTICKRIAFDGKRATGVELLPSNPIRRDPNAGTTVKATKEVILSAGAFETPHILLLSGVGPAPELSKHNISMVHESPSVGKNTRDHSAFTVEFSIDAAISGQNQLHRNPEAFAAAKKEWDTTHTGPLAVYGASAAVLFARIPELYKSEEFKALSEETQTFLSHPNRPSTELWFHGGPLMSPTPVEAEDSVLVMTGLCQNLLSKGSVSLQSSDPWQLPSVDPSYCAESFDWRIAIETIKLQLRVLDAPAIQAIIRQVIHGPGERRADGTVMLCSIDDEEAMRTYLKQELTQGYHALGSCVMGNDETLERVVDNQFRVVGLDGLRIADMSVCPVLTNNHTQINAYLIAERCAQTILGE